MTLHRILWFHFLICTSLVSNRARSVELNLRFDSLTIEDGLSHSKVNAIIQDHRGFMWFGTNDGLNRYDGYEIAVYQQNPNDVHSLSHNLVRDIYEDKRGNLWVATDAGGLNLYLREEDHFVHFRHEPNNAGTLSTDNLYEIIETEEGLWIASGDGLNRFDIESGTFRCFRNNWRERGSPGEKNEIHALFQDSAGLIWLGLSRGGIDFFNPLQEKFIERELSSEISLKDYSILEIAEDSRHRVWIGTDRNGLFLYDPAFNTLSRMDRPEGQPVLTPRAIIEDLSGNVWIGNREGLVIYNDESQTFRSFSPQYHEKHTLSHASVQCLCQDANLDIWVGTRGGVDHFNRQKSAFRFCGPAYHDSRYLNSNVVFSILEGPDGDLWIGTETGGLNYLDRETGHYTYSMHDPNNPNSLSSNNVKSICLDSKGIMWIGTFDGGLNRYDSATGRFAHYRHDPEDSTSISDNDVYSIVEDKGGDLWLATHFGVNVLDRATNQFVRHIHGEPQSISHNDCKVVYRDRSDQIWIGTFDGLNLYHSEDNSFEKFHHITGDSTTVSASHIQCLYEDDAGSFWIGTLGGGLNRMDREKKTFAAYTEKDGLMDNSVYGILEDEIGNLWLSSNDGLSRFDPERKTFRNYDTDDGLHSDQFTYNAFAKGATGELFFGGLQGFTSFFPDEIRDNEFIPSVVFTDFLIFNRSVVPDSIGSPLLKPISETSEIFLKHEQSVITFEFAALNFVSSNENEYAYMLENFDSQWHAIGPKRTVTFTNLDAGEYTLRVRGSNNDGRWNEDGASLRLVITPPYWGTLWFRSTIFAALVLGIFAFLRIRTNSISRSNAQLQQVVDKRTEELLAANRELETFAYSVSHDLRAPLRGINGFSQVLFEEYQDKLDQKGVDYIERIQRATRRMGKLIDSLLELSRIARRELVRSSIDVTSMAHSIVTELQQANPGRKVDFMVEPDLYVEADPELFRIVLENLLRNAWKFTEMTEKARVELGRTKAGEKGAFFIRDNGVGFDMAYANNLFVPFHRLHSGNDFEGTGIGLATVKRIISRHGGKVWAEGDRDKGATFYFKL